METTQNQQMIKEKERLKKLDNLDIEFEESDEALKRYQERLNLDPLAGENKRRGKFYWSNREAIINISHALVMGHYKNIVLKYKDGVIEATPTKIYERRNSEEVEEIANFKPGTLVTPPFFITVASAISYRMGGKFSLEVNVDSPFK